MAKAEILKPFILSWEGGYANHPNDRGGATNKGVTLATYRQAFGSRKTADDLKQMTDEQWTTVYRRYYWDKWRADDIRCQSVANLLVDWCWMSGRYGITVPQALLGVTVDGIVGPRTIAALNGYRAGQDALFKALWNDRRAYFEMVARKPGQSVFLKGWLNRLNGIKWGRLVCNGRPPKTVWF